MLKPRSKPLDYLKHSFSFLLNHVRAISGHRQFSGEVDPRSVFLKASQIINSDKKLDGYSLVSLIRACTQLGCSCYGQQLHSYVLQSGFLSNSYVSTAFVNFYVKFESLDHAHKLFDEIPEPGVVSWNSLISGHVHCGEFSKALCLFMQLESSGVGSDAFSFTAALAACGRLSLLRLGKTIHSKIVKYGDDCSVVTSNCLIDMYGKCGCVEEAIRLFVEMNGKDTISWNSVIAACARNQRLEQASSFLKQMPESDTISYNELINGIAQFGNIEDAIAILATMPQPDSSSWNSIITGYVNRNHAREALEFFSKMHFEGIRMDQFTFSSILSGVGSISALAWGTLVHCCSIRSGLDKSVVVGSALIDMYSKCGQVKEAELLFQSLSCKNLITWNAMISGYAHNGRSTKVIELFEQLKSVKHLKPNGITFVNVLSACWHNRMPFKVANSYLESMQRDYGIDPTAEHCSAIIRIMGQEGEVWRAQDMITDLGLGSDGKVWRALLGACGMCSDVDVAEIAAAKLTELEGEDEFIYVKLSNIYAMHEKWEHVGDIRKLMRDKQVQKEVGCSWMEV
ncbi:hypothetical protein DCAR_0207698 [Daucus carota subsp. sativus]|uniref:Pentacotripeptide-repeat region of PRORP domain-containing protein n=1 Tax=Daucus carota subsp. sativus TaxID=79200 RepID=A0AAF0WHS6_DAUCS|nr:PREDICTED: putative pentatricopeptide repeat-containing protein At5g47460 [Daucus carota subsp. sativus]WOG88463.1 hypothetical protein DCAR_0207698 [Daucus carota subsp. sativus]